MRNILIKELEGKAIIATWHIKAIQGCLKETVLKKLSYKKYREGNNRFFFHFMYIYIVIIVLNSQLLHLIQFSFRKRYSRKI